MCFFAAEFFPEHPSSSYYAYPVDPDSAMCLEVFAGMDIGRELVPGSGDCQPVLLPAVVVAAGPGTPGTPVRRYSTPGSSPSYDYCGPRSPNALSDNGKVNTHEHSERVNEIAVEELANSKDTGVEEYSSTIFANR